MINRRISNRDAEELAAGRVPSARPDLESLVDLLADYRVAATESHPRPSELMASRLDFVHSPMVLQPQDASSGQSGAAIRRAGSGLLGIGVAMAIITGAASGAAALVGSAGMLPPGAQSAFDQLVSVIVPTEGAADETTDDEEAPGDTLPDTGATTPPTATPTPEATESPEDAAPPVVVDAPPATEPSPEPAPSPSSSRHEDEDEDEDDDDEESDDEHENNGDNGNHGEGNNGNHGEGNNGNHGGDDD